MSTHLKPCHRCPLRDGCELRDEWRRKIARSGLVSAAFKCAKLAAALRPGRRIMVSVPGEPEMDRYGEPIGRHGYHLAKATITSSDNRGRYVCVVDAGQIKESPVIRDADKVRFRRQREAFTISRFLDEPDATLCKLGRVKRGAECDRQANDDCGCRFEDAAS